RRFSTRHGIIGQSWRQQALRYDPDVKAGDETKLIDEWGFTKETAGAVGYNRRTFFAYPLPVENNAAFILYFDAGPVGVLGEEKEDGNKIIQFLDNWLAENPNFNEKLNRIFCQSERYD